MLKFADQEETVISKMYATAKEVGYTKAGDQ